MRAALLLICLIGCASEPVEEPRTPEPAENRQPVDNNERQDAFVATHKKAVESCFGGFGKGAPYAGSFTIAGGSVTEATITALSEDEHGQLPADCIAKHFRDMTVPDGMADGALNGRFAVENPDCDLPACKSKDLPCTFKRDIACTVVLE